MRAIYLDDGRIVFYADTGVPNLTSAEIDEINASVEGWLDAACEEILDARGEGLGKPVIADDDKRSILELLRDLLRELTRTVPPKSVMKH